jgi:hypothetical protein
VVTSEDPADPAERQVESCTPSHTSAVTEMMSAPDQLNCLGDIGPGVQLALDSDFARSPRCAHHYTGKITALITPTCRSGSRTADRSGGRKPHLGRMYGDGRVKALGERKESPPVADCRDRRVGHADQDGDQRPPVRSCRSSHPAAATKPAATPRGANSEQSATPSARAARSRSRGRVRRLCHHGLKTAAPRQAGLPAHPAIPRPTCTCTRAPNYRARRQDHRPHGADRPVRANRRLLRRLGSYPLVILRIIRRVDLMVICVFRY